MSPHHFDQMSQSSLSRISRSNQRELTLQLDILCFIAFTRHKQIETTSSPKSPMSPINCILLVSLFTLGTKWLNWVFFATPYWANVRTLVHVPVYYLFLFIITICNVGSSAQKSENRTNNVSVPNVHWNAENWAFSSDRRGQQPSFSQEIVNPTVTSWHIFTQLTWKPWCIFSKPPSI